ncbi:hypothetical protein FRB90_007609 [Tulasnella sp. 427]|nr:hypothetical protein FRB90_007609 [Tulasnella sp. 427]
MASSSEQHSRYPPYSRRTASTDSGNVFSFTPPEDVLPRSGGYPSYVPATQLSGETELDDDPINWSSHSRNLTTGPTATSISFPLTPRTPGPPTPFTPSSNPPQEQRRVDGIQDRINFTPSTGESGGRRFAFMPPTRGTTQSQEQRLDSVQSRTSRTPPTGGSFGMIFAFMPPSRETIQSQEQRLESAQGLNGTTPSTSESAGMTSTFLAPPQEPSQPRPSTSSQLSAITEMSAQEVHPRDSTDRAENSGLLSDTGDENRTKRFYSSSDLYAASVSPSPDEIPNQIQPAPWIDEEEDSPYEEVRAAVSNTDDTEMPCLTWRMWATGLPLCILIGGLEMRYYSPSFEFFVILICVYLLGKASEHLPVRSFDVGPFTFDLNPGPFNIKEHAAATVLATSSITVYPVSNFLLVVEKAYNVKPPSTFSQIVLVLSCQFIGISLGGVFRRLVVPPARLIWPSVLGACAVLNVFQAGFGENGMEHELAGVSFFAYTTLAAALYSFIPDDKVVNQLFGSVTGLGMSGLTFDWLQISWFGNPLFFPWWATAHLFAGFVFIYWVLTPILYYTDVWKTGHLPVMANSVYDRFAKPYDIERIIDRTVMRLNVTAYEEYSQPYLPAAYAMRDFVALVAPTLLLTHTALHHGPDVLRWIRQRKDVEPEDIHAKLMRSYPDTPTWWYLVLFAVSFPSLLVVLKVEPQLDIPVWVGLLVLVLSVVFILPIVFIYATASGALLLTGAPQALMGILLPGKPLPNLFAKSAYSNIVMVGLIWLQWLKFGHYIKVPPRAMLYATAQRNCNVELLTETYYFVQAADAQGVPFYSTDAAQGFAPPPNS